MTNTGGSAFPAQPMYRMPDGTEVIVQQNGMTLRDYFAANALAAMIGLENKDGHKRGAAGVPILAMYAYEYADAMLSARGAT